jgi:hypothetical protein
LALLPAAIDPHVIEVRVCVHAASEYRPTFGVVVGVGVGVELGLGAGAGGGI